MEKPPLSKGKGVEVLLELLKGPQNFSQLASNVGGSYSTIQLRLYEYINAGLIEEEKQETFPPKRVLKLTTKGYAVARVLRNLDEVMEKEPETLSRKQKWILTLLHALGGEIKGSTRLQKLLFLLEREFDVIGDEYYEFKPLHFGPFSWEIIKDTEELQKAGFIDVEQEVFESEQPFEDGLIRRNYKLSLSGERIAFEIFNNLSERNTQALLELRRFNGMKLPELVDYVYSKYPEYAHEGDF